jgi:hypothetical protein
MRRRRRVSCRTGAVGGISLIDSPEISMVFGPDSYKARQLVPILWSLWTLEEPDV